LITFSCSCIGQNLKQTTYGNNAIVIHVPPVLTLLATEGATLTRFPPHPASDPRAVWCFVGWCSVPPVLRVPSVLGHFVDVRRGVTTRLLPCVYPPPQVTQLFFLSLFALCAVQYYIFATAIAVMATISVVTTLLQTRANLQMLSDLGRRAASASAYFTLTYAASLRPISQPNLSVT
jgi:hypothetical protein